MIASLPMYDRPETRAAHDRLWQGIARRVADAPHALTRAGSAPDHWARDDLLLSQTCGLPFRAGLHRRLAIVGTPDHGLAGCPTGHYRSVVIATKPTRSLADLDGLTFAVNDPASQSGWAAPIAEGLRPGRVLVTGSHGASIRAVAEGGAAAAAIDAVTWRMAERWDGVTGLHIVHLTRPTPGLPLVTAFRDRVGELRHAVAAAVDDLAPEDRDTLGLRGLALIPAAAYLALPLPPPPGDIAQTA